VTITAGNILSPNHPPARQGPIGGPGPWYELPVFNYRGGVAIKGAEGHVPVTAP